MRRAVQTFTGRTLSLTDPDPADVCIEDIAHALAQTCRFNGMTRDFYSVAEHSVLVSMFSDPADMLHGLLHDASEAYLGDMVTPLKRHPRLKGYRHLEANVQHAIWLRFELAPAIPASVKAADERMLATEIRDLMVPSAWPAGVLDLQALPIRLHPMPPIQAERAFLDRYTQLLELRTQVA
jgi:hypothetical protein